MLNLEYLLEEAKNNGLPILKRRGVLREYLQVIILSCLYKHKFGKLLFFTGGTALRFFYDMPRFSEDLDFDTADLKFEEFKEILVHIEKSLIQEGFTLSISAVKRNNLYIAELRFRDIMKLYGITDKRGLDLMIKVEVYKPSWNLRSEQGVLSLYGYSFSSRLLAKGILFSEKLCALFNRNRGRDIYDTLFMLRKKFPFDKNVLRANKIEGPPKMLILKHIRNLSNKELKFLADQVKPFLFKEDDIDLLSNAALYAERFLEGYEE